jgi:hypothetical protein
MSPLLFIGPAVAVLGLVAVVFVMRHKSVEKRSMYSARRSQIEHKVRAARQRTLAPMKHAEKSSPAEEAAAPAAGTLNYEPSAFAGPPVAPPPRKGQGAQPVWDARPTAPAPEAPAFTPQEQPAQPAYEPPPYEAPAEQPVWTPTPEPVQAERSTPLPSIPQTSAAGAGATWSVVGETKGTAEPEPAHKGKKRSKEDALSQVAGSWQLASGEVAGSDDVDDGPRKPSTAIAVAQYAVLVVGLVMVLIGVVVMVANSHVT